MRPQLLIIEDDVRLAGSHSAMLRRYGYDCQEVYHPGEVLKQAVAHQPALILCSLSVGGVSGLEILKRLRGNESTAAVPIVVMSGSRDETTTQEARRLGAAGVLHKPFLERELVAMVSAQLAEPKTADLFQFANQSCEDFQASYRRILESIAEGITISDFTHRIRFANPAAERILGSAPLRDRNLREFLSPEQHEKLNAQTAPCLEGREARFELVARRGDGVPCVLELTAAPHREDGRYLGLLAIFRDATVRREEEEQLRLRTAAVNAAANGIVITTVEGTIIWANPAFATLTGYSVEEAIGHTPRVLKSGIQPMEFYTEMWRTLRDGRPWRGELINRRKNGTLYHEEMTITPVHDAHGELTNFIAVKNDITGRKLDEQTLRESEALYRSLMDHLPHNVFRKDREGRFTYVNHRFCETVGRSAVELIGKTDADVFPSNLADKFIADDQHLLSTGAPFGAVEHNVDASGKETVVEVKKLPVRNSTGEIVGSQGIFWDITDRVRAEQEREKMELQLRQAQKLEAIGQLAAGIAHEINTPIQYIGDNLRFFQETFGDLSEALDHCGRLLTAARKNDLSLALIAEVGEAMNRLDLAYLQAEIPTAVAQALHGVSRVAEIVRAMKEFSHPGSDQKTPLDLNRAIENTLTVARNEWKYVSDVVTRFDPNLPHVSCVGGEFNQVILNLVVNAAHAIADVQKANGNGSGKGTITITTERQEGEAIVRVQDTGTGIPENIRRRIFDPFFTTKEVGRGTGQGLAIAHSVIERHGGRIHFETEVGRGTTFVIHLPIGELAVAA